MKKRWLLAFGALLLLYCHQVRDQSQRPYPLQVDAPAILANLQKRIAFGKDTLFSGSAKVKAKDEKGKESSLEFEFLSARPGFVLVRGPIDVGNPTVFWAMDGNTFQFQNVGKDQHRFYYGKAIPCNLRQLLPNVPLSLYPNQIVEMLLGEAPLLEDVKSVDLFWDGSYGKHGAELLTLQNSQGLREKIWLSKPIDGDVLKVEWYENSRETPTWRVEHQDFQSLEDDRTRFPQKTKFTYLATDQSVDLKWLDRTIEQNVEPAWRDRFRLQDPADGTKAEELTCE